MSEIKVNSIVDASGGSTVQVNGFTPTVSNMAGRNRIINGDMRIDQRNAGAAVTGHAVYSVDRFIQINNVVGCTYSVQQDSSAPQGFTNSLKVTITAAASPVSATQINLRQYIEGFNTADLNWGTANAKTVTLSFWVKSSLTGTFGGAISNNAFDRVYAYEYAINSANTWEYKTVTITGDTTGTWETGNSAGMRVIFGLGTTDYKIAAGVWNSGYAAQSTGSVDLCATNGATWQVTGVQLEVGSVATPFEHRQYGQELALCQRYCYVGNSDDITSAIAGATTGIYTASKFPTTMRANPSATASGSIRISDNYFSDYTASASVTVNNLGVNGGRMFLTGFSGLTVARFYSGYDAGTGGKLIFSAEL